MRSALSVLGLIAAMLLAAACERGKDSPFEVKDGYEDATFAIVKTTLETREGPRPVRISLKKLLVEGERRAAIELPARGLVIIQHRAGNAELDIAGEEFVPLEGEWLALGLPVELTVRTEDDSVLMDMIVIEE